MLLLVAAFAVPLAAAQTAPPPAEPPVTEQAPASPEAGSTTEEAVADVVDIDIAGEIVIVGRRGDRNIQQATTQVISVLSTEDIARTGDGDVAGALSRVTGLSVASNGFVYVRGLGDRYSQAFLNGSPLHSADPWRPAVPLDIFPTDPGASARVQHSHPPHSPGGLGCWPTNFIHMAVPQ